MCVFVCVREVDVQHRHVIHADHVKDEATQFRDDAAIARTNASALSVTTFLRFFDFDSWRCTQRIGHVNV